MEIKFFNKVCILEVTKPFAITNIDKPISGRSAGVS